MSFMNILSDTHYMNKDRKSKSALMIFWFFGDFFIKSFYGTLLLTYLLRTGFEAPINTIEDALKQVRDTQMS